MNKIKIDWRHSNRWGWVGLDEAGNLYCQGDLRETTGVTMVDGREGGGWTPEDALDSAMRRTEPTENYELEKAKLLEGIVFSTH